MEAYPILYWRMGQCLWPQAAVLMLYCEGMLKFLPSASSLYFSCLHSHIYSFFHRVHHSFFPYKILKYYMSSL